jgi:hypothetical protein
MDTSFKSNILPALAFLVVILIFIYTPFKAPKTPVESYLKNENIRLKKANDSLNLIIKKNEFIFDEMSRTIVELANQKKSIKYVYNEKYKEIRFFTNSRIVMEFDSIFAKSHIR